MVMIQPLPLQFNPYYDFGLDAIDTNPKGQSTGSLQSQAPECLHILASQSGFAAPAKRAACCEHVTPGFPPARRIYALVFLATLIVLPAFTASHAHAYMHICICIYAYAYAYYAYAYYAYAYAICICICYMHMRICIYALHICIYAYALAYAICICI